MYQISVPISINNIGRMQERELLEWLHTLDAHRVMLAVGVYQTDSKKRAEEMDKLRRYTAFLKENGFEVCAWYWTFGVSQPHDFTPLRLVTEEKKDVKGSSCPSDPAFVAFVTDYLAEVASCGVDMILFDDDFRYSVLEGGNVGCICKNHMARIEKHTGERLERSALVKYILSGGKNKVRDAWIAANGEVFEDFARAVREKIDTVAPQVRVGLCACLSSWDLDGTTAGKLAHILAGEHTKPFVRLIGAPYWAARNSWGCMMQDTIEQERMESAWTRDGEIEILAEGDSYPRPRVNCPASYLEGFDLAMRASGAVDGILKYAFDYVSGLGYEPGYVNFHRRNKPIYAQMDSFFANKKSVGVRVYEFPQKVADMELGDEITAPANVYETFFSSSSRSLSACSIPTTYEGEGVCGAAFGQNARYLTPEMRRNGVILDAEAAKILFKLGVDVGIRSLGKPYVSAIEHVLDPDEYAPTEGANIFDHVFSENIRVCSEARISEEKGGLSHDEVAGKSKTVPVSYFYENADGERYLVLNFDARYQTNAKGKALSSVIMRHYARSRQYASAVEWLSRGKSLPAYCFGNPNLYTMVKKRGDCMTVGLWNFFADPVLEPKIQLDGVYQKIRFLNCEGTLDGDTVTLSEIAPYGFVAFEVEKYSKIINN